MISYRQADRVREVMRPLIAIRQSTRLAAGLLAYGKSANDARKDEGFIKNSFIHKKELISNEDGLGCKKTIGIGHGVCVVFWIIGSMAFFPSLRG
ncbi:hypothetical protein D3C73_604570 [compost metagenome]